MKYIIRQTTNYNGAGDKTGTHTVQMDASEIAGYIALLDGEVEVYAQDVALSVTGSTATSSNHLVDFIKISHNVLKPIYISNGNKRPIVFNVAIDSVITSLKALKPFDAPYSADFPKDVSIDTGKAYLM